MPIFFARVGLRPNGGLRGRDAVLGHPVAHADRPAVGQLADRRGYVIYVMAQSVPHEMYRAWAEIMKDGAKPEVAVDKAFKRIEEIFAKYKKA